MKEEIDKAIEVLKRGGIILYPTDTIWGIGCDAKNKQSITRIFEIKKRAENKALISLVKNSDMINKFTDSNQLNISIPKKPTTIIYQNVSGLASHLISKNNTAAFRIPLDNFCKKLVTLFDGPIVSTSANISGEDSPKIFSEISQEIKNNVDYIVNLRHNELMDISSSIILINKDKSITKIR